MYKNFDAFLDEVDGLPESEKGFELGDEKFILPAILPAKLMLKLSRLGSTDQDQLRGMDLTLQTLLGDEQYERVLELVPDIIKLNRLATKIIEMYTSTNGNNSKNASKVQRQRK